MKFPSLLPVLLAALAFAGCDDVPSTLREGLQVPVKPHVRNYAAPERAVYAAARAALGPLGFKFEHGGPAQREIEAVSYVTGGEEAATARQFTLRAEFETSLDGSGTDVTVRMTEIDEEGTGRNRALATEAPLSDTPLYDVFFKEIQKQLATPPPPKQTP